MDYTDETVSEVAMQYALLRESLERLRDARRDKDGAVLGYLSEHFGIAYVAIESLESMPYSLKERLKIGELETELHEFANTMLRL